MTDRSYRSIEEMVHEVSEDKSFAEEFEREAKNRQIVHHLFAARSSRGLSQNDIASRLGCSQSRISKLENGIDDDIRLGDLKDYLHALEQDMSLFICQKDWKSFQQIKFYSFMIRRNLRNLVNLAGDDPNIEQGVSKAHIETLCNLVKFVLDSARGLPSFPQIVPGIIEADGTAEEFESDPSPTTSLACKTAAQA